MKVKTLGFKWERPLPAGISIDDFYEHIRQSDHSVTPEYEIFMTEIKDGSTKWWAGVVLRIRDSKNYTALKKNKAGKRVLSAQSMANGHLVEPSFFVADGKTGSGLFSNHYLAVSINALARVFECKFCSLLEMRKKAALSQVTSSAEKKKVSKYYQGVPKMMQLCHAKDFEARVREYDKIKSAEMKFSTINTVYRQFLALEKVSKSTKVSFNLDEATAKLYDATSAIIDAAKTPGLMEAKIMGLIKGNERTTYLTKDTGLIFGERDYDNVVNRMSLDLDDWQQSIQNSDMIKLLIKDAKDKSVALLLRS